ncbi:MAG: hypothetical protein IKN74_04295 [Clostridia bacterium]|nr:hypothetical protein [Clostridia bacterium]
MEKKKVEKAKSAIIVILLIIILAFVIYEINKSRYNQVSDIYQNLVSNATKEIESKEVNEVKDEKPITSKKIASGEYRYPLITNSLNDIDVLFVTNATLNDDKTITLDGVIYTRYLLSAEEMNEVIENGQIVLQDKTYKVEYNAEDESYWCLEGDEEYPLYVLKKFGDSTSYELSCLAQISTCYRLTDSYRTIVIPEDLVITFDFADVESMTAKEYFGKIEPLDPVDTFTPLSDRTFSFVIENGVCTEIINNLTSI